MTRRLLLSLAALLLALAALEVGVRLLRPQPLAAMETPELLRGAFTAPGEHPSRTGEYAVTVHVNAQGFVDREWGPRTPGRVRVVVLGDSFVQAAQVPLEDGFGRVLESILGPEVEVLSLGVPGAGTATALGVLERYALPLQPDLVLLGFLVGNDVLNASPLLEPKDDKPFLALEHGALVPTSPADTLARPWRLGPLWRWSHAWRLVSREIARRHLAARRIALGAGLPLDLRVHDPAPSPAWDEAWAVTDALVGALAARCDRAGVRFATLLFPTAEEATAVGRAAALTRWPAIAGWDLDAARRRAGVLAAAHGPVLDLQPAFAAAEAADPAPLYFPEDGHWTARGHRVAAEAVAPFVAEGLGLPATSPSPPSPSSP
jgi:lysophospholipase L1-like esterase